MIKVILFCDKCEKEWDRQAGKLELGNFNVTCKECIEAENTTEEMVPEVAPEAPEETV